MDEPTVETNAATMLPSEYIDKLRPLIVRLKIGWIDDAGKRAEGHGTGIVVGRRRDAGDIIIATARHVIDAAPRDRNVDWTLLQQHDSTGDVHRTITFTTGPGAGIIVSNNVADLAFFVVFKSFIPTDDHAEDYDGPAPVIDPRKGPDQGSPVAWAGFPGVVEDFLGYSQLVVHGGVVGVMIHGKGKRPRLIMDGHAVRGVSGGPVWFYNDRRQRVEVAAIIVGAAFNPNDLNPYEMPGYIEAEPIGPIMTFLEKNRQVDGDWIITDCRD